VRQCRAMAARHTPRRSPIRKGPGRRIPKGLYHCVFVIRATVHFSGLCPAPPSDSEGSGLHKCRFTYPKATPTRPDCCLCPSRRPAPGQAIIRAIRPAFDFPASSSQDRGPRLSTHHRTDEWKTSPSVITVLRIMPPGYRHAEAGMCIGRNVTLQPSSKSIRKKTR